MCRKPSCYLLRERKHRGQTHVKYSASSAPVSLLLSAYDELNSATCQRPFLEKSGAPNCEESKPPAKSLPALPMSSVKRIFPNCSSLLLLPYKRQSLGNIGRLHGVVSILRLQETGIDRAIEHSK